MPGIILFVNDHTNESFVNSFKTTIGIQPNQLVANTPSTSAITNLSRQLEINETITLEEFNARVAADPNYPTVVHLNRLRILVVLSSFMDHTNRNLADIVLFVKGGLASVEFSKFGPPRQTWETQRLNIWNLINGVRGSGVACFPFPGFLPPPQQQTPENPKPPERLCPHRIEGMGTLELRGVEYLEGAQGIREGVFGDKLHHNRPFPLGAAQKIEDKENRRICKICGCDEDEIAFGDQK